MTNYITKDSGERVQFKSGMQRDVSVDKDRPDLMYMPFVRMFLDAQPNNEDLKLEVIQLATTIVESVRNEQVLYETHFDSFLIEFKKYCSQVYGWDDMYLLQELTGVMTRGAKKYTEDNWKQANSHDERKRFGESFLRHLFQFLREEDDEAHFAAVLFNLQGLYYLKDLGE